MKKSILAIAALIAASGAFAQTPVVNQQCPTGDTGSCTNQNQMRDNISSVTGDTTAPVSSSQQGVASASNASGNSINPNIHVDPQVSQNSTNATTGTINGTNTNGNDHASATGGSAIGNDSKNDNRSSVGDTSTGASTATNGNNSNGANTNGSNSNGANTNTSLTGGNTMTGGANTATNTANGGAGGLGGTGGQGGTGGSSTSNGTNLGINGQQQGIAGSGNSDNKNTNSNGQGQGQGQQQANNGTNAQGQSSTNKLSNGSNSGGNSLSNGSSSSSGSTSNSGGNTMSNGSNSGGNSLGQSSNTSNDGSGNSSTRVDASDNSVYNNKTIFIPAIVPATPASQLAVGNIVKETSACGPLQAISKREIKGTFHGIFSTSEVPQGFHQELVPYIDVNGVEQQYKHVPLPTGDGYRVYGHQVTQYTTVVGVSGARNIAIGGGGSSGSWGQGGMGTSSANQQLVTTLQLRLCEIGTVKYPQVVKMIEEVPVYIEVERKPKKN